MGPQPNHSHKSNSQKTNSQKSGAQKIDAQQSAPPASKASNIAKMIAKLVVGGALLYYVLSSGMVNFKSLGPALFAPRNLLLSLIFLSFSALLCAFRWYLLASVQGISVTFRQIFELTMIGNFFNTFLPGAVGGDLIKAWYIAGHSQQKKTHGIFTVLLDRMIGLSVIIFYGAVSLAFFLELFKREHRLQIIGYSLWTFTAFALVGATLFFTPYLWKQAWFSKAVAKAKVLGPLGKIIEATALYRNHPRTIITALLLSAVSVFGITMLYELHGISLGIPLEKTYYFFVVPMGVVASAIPLLPGGIGVGQVAFFTLFRWVGATPEHGATLCTLLQVHTILFNCSGLLFYLKYKHKTPGIASDLPVAV